MHDPRAVLEERLGARRATVATLERRDARIALGRLAAFLALAAAAVGAFALHRSSPAWLIPPCLAFIALILAHDRTLAALARGRRAVAFHESALRRMGTEWPGTGDPGDRYADPDHPYALDLDLFGRGSLFELLSTARTRPGADALASWLLRPAPVAEARVRQRAVADLVPRLDLREDLAVLGEDVRAEVHPERLSAWAEAPRAMPAWIGLPAALLAAASVAALVGWLAERVSPVPFLALALAQWGVARLLRARIHRVLGGVERPGSELAVLAQLLARLEREAFTDEHLRSLQRALVDGAAPPARAAAPDAAGASAGASARAPVGRRTASRRIGRLGRIVERAGWADNQLFAPFAFLLLWRIQAARAVERWRAAHGGSVRAWLAAVAELEALSSLAAHGFLHPADPFPALDDGGARFDGEGLRHPLMAEERGVPNDVRLGDAPRLLVVSGSNMSGKSTLLRTVGTNAVLALAGAPVRARRLRLSALQIGATLRIQDSLAEGKSRFWAEITRLRAILDRTAGSVPVLFLLDELLAGTNSRDRRIGAETVLRTLLARGAIGLVTTHDLALSELATALGGSENAHFEDEVRGGEVVFDYRLRPGVVTHSNAIALMRAVGLDV
jgi:hypothetical protein